MLILAATVLALLAVPLLGGRLSRLGDLRLRGSGLALGALALQVVVISVVPHWPRSVLVPLHACSYVLAALVLWLNRRSPGLPWIAAGGGLNALAISLNAGQMPADAQALAQAGITTSAEGFVNSGVITDPRVPYLGDVFASPSWLPLQNVYSVGDLLILIGAVWAVHRTCGTAPARRLADWVSPLRSPSSARARHAAPRRGCRKPQHWRSTPAPLQGARPSRLERPVSRRS